MRLSSRSSQSNRVLVAWGAAAAIALTIPFACVSARTPLADVLGYGALAVLAVAALAARWIGLARATIVVSAACAPLAFVADDVLQRRITDRDWFHLEWVWTSLLTLSVPIVYALGFGVSWLVARGSTLAPGRGRAVAAR